MRHGPSACESVCVWRGFFLRGLPDSGAPGPRTSPSDVSGASPRSCGRSSGFLRGRGDSPLDAPSVWQKDFAVGSFRTSWRLGPRDGRKPYPSAPLLAAWVAGEGERGQGDPSPVSQQTCPHPRRLPSPRLPWWMLASWLLPTWSGWGRRGTCELCRGGHQSHSACCLQGARGRSTVSLKQAPASQGAGGPRVSPQALLRSGPPPLAD